MFVIAQQIKEQRAATVHAARTYADYISNDGLWPVCKRGHDWHAAYTCRERHLFEAFDAERRKLKTLEGGYLVGA